MSPALPLIWAKEEQKESLLRRTAPEYPELPFDISEALQPRRSAVSVTGTLATAFPAESNTVPVTPGAAQTST
jgi:hypothetical protein